MKSIGKTLPKVDARANVLGAPVYVEDYRRLPGTLIVKVLRSPYAHARIRSINTRIAQKVPGVVAVFTYEEGKEIAVVFPDLDVATSGENDADALASARELLGAVLYGMEEDGDPIPAPTPLNAVKLEENERAALVDVYMPSIRLAKVNRAVNRTVTIPA